MNAEVLAFLVGEPGKIALFAAYEAAVLACGVSTRTVTKTQLPCGHPSLLAILSHPRRAADRTLTDEESGAVIARVLEALEATLGAVLR